jgi:hypothetical protein
VTEQADEISKRLTESLDAHLARVPPSEFVRLYKSLVVARVTVAGYENSRPKVDVRGIAVLGDGSNGWRVQTQTLPRLTFSQCGVRFQGEEAVVDALKSDTDSRLRREDRTRPEVSLLKSPDGKCSDAATARSLFLTVVRLTIAHAPEFGIRDGAVGEPFDLMWIPESGDLRVERLSLQ